MQNSSDGFARRFGEVYQHQWIYGDGSIDLVAEIGKIAAAGIELAEQLGMQDLNIDEGGFRMFRPMNPENGMDTLVLLERYDNLQVWAAAECAAQTSTLWMKAILDNQSNEHTWLGEGSHMLDDALDAPRDISSDRIAVDWVCYNPTKQAALVDFPLLVRELSAVLHESGFDETAVRYFGMTTAAGPDLNLAHIWLEHSSAAVMGEVLAWRQSAPELRDWRHHLNSLHGEIRAHHMLVQVD